jgi:hypothetical protein
MDASADAGAVDAGCLAPAAYYRDADGDGFGRADIERLFCVSPGKGWAERDGDCDDDDANVFPGQTRYFPASYSAAGRESFDYDCSGAEDPDPSAEALAPNCPTLALLLCAGAGFASTGRMGAGVDPTCGSATRITCSGVLACVATTSTVSPKGCR